MTTIKKNLASNEISTLEKTLNANELAVIVDDTDFSGTDLSFYTEGYETHAVHELVRIKLSRFLNMDKEFDYPRCAALLDCDPSKFSNNDISLAVRAIWKSGRVGFYKDGRDLYPNRWVSKLLRQLENPSLSDAILPKYPEPSRDFKPVEYWNGYDGFLPTQSPRK